MKVFGVDISVWQKGINLKQVKQEGAKFAIIRGAFTGSANGKPKAKDTQFENHYTSAKENGFGVGVYYFSRACSYIEGVEEANYLYNNCLKGKTFEYPIYIDVEDNVYQIKSGKNNVTSAIIGFCETLENLGYYVGVYANINWIKNYINYNELKDKYDFWIALWNANSPGANYKYGMWQFGGETNKIRTNKMAGYVCDQNYAYKDYPTIMKNVGLNGFDKVVKPVESIKPEIIVEDVIENEPIDDELTEPIVENEPIDDELTEPIVEKELEENNSIELPVEKKNFWHYFFELLSAIIKSIKGVKK